MDTPPAESEPASTPDHPVLPRLALLGIWTIVTLFLVSRHVMWADEVRALSIALQGDNVIEMLRSLQGEGHPAIWYLLLRGAYAIVPVNEVLPAVAWLAAFAAMLILVLKSPFRLGTIALIMFGAFGLFEFTVTARNYGIAMLLLFAIAWLYPRHRYSGVVIGVLLALLCNTNVHAAFFAAGLLGFWLIEITSEEGVRWTRKHRVFALNAAVATIGAALCFIAVYPPAQDAVVRLPSDGITFGSILHAISSPAELFVSLLPPQFGDQPLATALLTVLLLGALLGLARSPGAIIAAATAMIAVQLFMQLVYLGSYRHTALFLVYLVTLYWLVGEGRGGQWPARTAIRLGRIAKVSAVSLTALLVLQLPLSLILLRQEAAGVPDSRSYDLSMLIYEQGLTESPIIANADVILEPIPYYAPNPLWLLRENKFGKVVRFSRDNRDQLDLNVLLEEADKLNRALGKPVIILMQYRLEPGSAHPTIEEGFGGTFAMPVDQVDRFLGHTRRIARFAPANTNESYDVYLYPGR